MLQTTIDAARALLKADPHVTPADRSRLMAVIRNHGRGEANQKEVAVLEPRLIRRAEAARRLGCSHRTIDSWAAAGIIQKVKLPGRVRAAGFRERDLINIIEGNCQPV